MRKISLPVRILRFYVEGFRSMTIGKTLWAIILIKLFIMFAILKVFFLPSFLGKFDSPSDKQEYVAGELVDRAAIFTK
jgi:hypothetical protein